MNKFLAPHAFSTLTILLTLTSVALTCADTDTDKQACIPEAVSCEGDIAKRCLADGTGSIVEKNCANEGLVCTEPQGCAFCFPNQEVCVGAKLLRCNAAGSGYLAEPLQVCDADGGSICDSGKCVNACELARENRSYVGCEYWAVDLDNAVVRIGSAAAQQFAVVLSNPSALPAHVTVSTRESAEGTGEGEKLAEVKVFRELTVQPQALEVLLLPSREVDGSPAGEYNTGTGTAISSAAYKIESSAPLIAYQFNPLSNVGVFSNDASLLIPVGALSSDNSGESGAPYAVMGWPQTIATTNDPRTNFGSDLRAFLTVVATRDDTTVRVEVNTAVVGDGKEIAALRKGDAREWKLNAYEVLNLETGGFGPDADFTGSRVESDRPVAVFSGSEASDVPAPRDLTLRRCCADHLEQQLYPLTTLGRSFIALKTPSRSKALETAGARIEGKEDEKEYFRILATGEITAVTTNLPHADRASFSIPSGEFEPIEADRDFTIQATEAVVVGQFVSGQGATGIPQTLPGGDPSFILLPSVEQFREDYLFLTPDKYAFDFILIAAPKGTVLRLDGRTLKEGCDKKTGQKICCEKTTVGKIVVSGDVLETEFESYKCQLSFPIVREGLTPPKNLEQGVQNDGVHRLTATQPVGLVVYGFDAFVSYGYPGGTDLDLINVD